MTIEASPGRGPLDLHRLVVAGATFDEIDAQKKDDEIDTINQDMISVASTVDVDNTHPYLMKYADIYRTDSTDASSVSTGPTFVGVKPPSRFREGQKVVYTVNNGPSEAVVLKVLYDDENHPHYTIKLASGKEEQASSMKLDQNTTTIKGATDENGDAPIRCANFRTNPTPLFQSLYHGNWEDSLRRLQTNPSEAAIWVARYAKNGPGSFDERDVLWQLLPLHLFIALGGRARNESTTAEDGVPDDEKDEIEQMEKESEDVKTPPMQLLDALLAAYPEATQCTDDQGMIPLQSAIRGNVSLSITEKLLDADPSSVYRRDVRGRNAFVLAEKVYGRSIHKQQVGSEDTTKETKYQKLSALLSEAARQVSSPPRNQPNKEKSRAIQQKTQEEIMQRKLQQLQNENLALRKENAELHHRNDINTRMLKQLVEKLQMYEDQKSVDIENYNEIFGSAYELADRREGILLSISEDDDGGEGGKGQTQEEKEEAEHPVEKQVGGDGAYHKRLERYLQATPKNNKGELDIISPKSAVTEATVPETPAATLFVLMPKFESAGEDDANKTEVEESDEEVAKTLDYCSTDDAEGEKAAALAEEDQEREEENALENDVDGAKEDEVGSLEHSESDDSSSADAQGQDIFRPRVAGAQLDVAAKAAEDAQEGAAAVTAESPTAFLGDIDMTACPEARPVATGDDIATHAKNQMQSSNDTAGEKGVDSEKPAVLPVLSREEEDQLLVE